MFACLLDPLNLSMDICEISLVSTFLFKIYLWIYLAETMKEITRIEK